MSAVLQVQEPGARYLAAVQPALVRQFELLATAPGGVGRLRELILTLAVQGNLVPQDAREESAASLLERIAKARARLLTTGELRRSKDSTAEVACEPPHSLPPGWAWSTLAAVGLINPRNDAEDDVMASFVQMSSIPVAFNDQHATEPRPWRDIKSGFTQFAEGDVGVAKITPCFENGKSTVFRDLSNGIGAGTTELHIVRPLCGIEPRYVLLFLKSPGFLRDGEATMTGTAGQKRLPRAHFENCPFPLPPLAEQDRIVARVDELMRLCDALEAQGRLEAEQHARLLGTLLGTLTNSNTPEELAANWQRVADHFDLLLDRPEAVDALEQTILQLAVRGLLVQQDLTEEPAIEPLRRLLAKRAHKGHESRARQTEPGEADTSEDPRFELPAGWTWAKAQDLSSPSSIITYGVLKPEWVEVGVPTVRVQDIQAGSLRVNQVGHCAPARAAKFGKTELKEGDLLIAKDGATLGKTAFVPKALEGGNITQHVLRFSIDANFNRDYVRLVIDSPHGQDWMRGETQGVALPGVNVGDFRRMPVPLPPIREQARIISRVTELRRLCAALRQRLSASQTTQSHLAETLVESAAA